MGPPPASSPPRLTLPPLLVDPPSPIVPPLLLPAPWPLLPSFAKPLSSEPLLALQATPPARETNITVAARRMAMLMEPILQERTQSCTTISGGFREKGHILYSEVELLRNRFQNYS